MKLWVNKIWLYLMYAIGVVLAVCLIVHWNDMMVLSRCMYGVAIVFPLHVLEEWQYPAGFHYQYNYVYHSKQPDRYPMCKLSDMITNLGGEVLFLAFILIAPGHESIALANMLFCFLECIVHTILGVQSKKRFQDKGKRTIYGPGSITAYFGFGVIGLILLFHIPWSVMTVKTIFIGILLLLGELLFMIVLPENLLKKPDNNWAFENAGYFEKYLK